MKGLAFFYSDGNSQHLASNCAIIFGSLLRQLISRCLSQRSKLSVINAVKARFSEPTIISLEYVLSSLNWISELFSDVFLVIDGADECSDREEFCESLAQLVESRKIKVLIASRPEHDIVTAAVFTAKPTLNIDDAVKDDIATHVSRYMDRDRKLKRLGAELKGELLKAITAKCDGMWCLTCKGRLIC